MAKYDLLLKGGHLIDPASGTDSVRDLAVSSGRIAAIESDIPVAACDKVINASGAYVLPGLIDFHTHAYWGVCEYGVEPDITFLPRGVTTVLDVGSAGAFTFPGFRRYVIEPSQTRIYALLNIATIGMVHTVGELIGGQYVDPERTASVATENSDVVVGIKVRLSRRVAGEQDWDAFLAARKAADTASLPLMIHFGDTASPLSKILDRMNQGDILTHCFTGQENNIIGEDGRVLPAALEASRRGVIFDVGHGMGSFSFEVARAAFDQGFLPDVISSDLHAFSEPHPVKDLLTTMTKFLEMGMSLPEVVRRVTAVPAALLGQKGKLGALSPGLEADISVVRELQGEFHLWDACGNSLTSPRLLSPVLTLKGGRLY